MAVWLANAGPGGARPVLFLDRDGLIIREKDYLADPAGVELLPGVAEAMVRARAAGFQLIGVSNQSGIGRGYFSRADFCAVMSRLDALLASRGAFFDGFYFCPHGPNERCACRKPGLGLLQEARLTFQWDRQLSWVLGDKYCDVALGQNAQLGSVLVLTGHGESEQDKVRGQWPDERRVLVANDLAEAVSQILAVNDGLAGSPRS